MVTFFILMSWVSVTPQLVQVMPLQTVIDTDTCYILPKGSREMTTYIMFENRKHRIINVVRWLCINFIFLFGFTSNKEIL